MRYFNFNVLASRRVSVSNLSLNLKFVFFYAKAFCQNIFSHQTIALDYFAWTSVMRTFNVTYFAVRSLATKFAASDFVNGNLEWFFFVWSCDIKLSNLFLLWEFTPTDFLQFFCLIRISLWKFVHRCSLSSKLFLLSFFVFVLLQHVTKCCGIFFAWIPEWTFLLFFYAILFFSVVETCYWHFCSAF